VIYSPNIHEVRQKQNVFISLISVSGTGAIALLGDRSNWLYSFLCFHYEPSKRWVEIPGSIQTQIDSGEWAIEVDRLLEFGLIEIKDPAQ
jgi:hypothetical protein